MGFLAEGVDLYLEFFVLRRFIKVAFAHAQQVR
jgi:hypothetical protein